MAGSHSAPRRSKKNNNNVLMVLLALIAVIACVVAVWAVLSMKKLANTPAAPVVTSEPVSASTPTSVPTPVPTPTPLTNSIALPQMAWINLEADKTEQAKTFTNPQENFAQFRVTVFMDGEVLWQSKFLKPGETSAPMVLVHTLSPGEYDANLIYECVTNDAAKSPLNGANSPIKLKVY